MRKAMITSQIVLDDEAIAAVKLLKENKINISELCRKAIKAAATKIKVDKTEENIIK